MKKVAIVLLSGSYSSSASSLLDVVQIANCHIAELDDQDNACIECDIVSLNGRSVQATEGFQIASNGSLDAASPQYDLIFVPASDYPDSNVFLERLASFKPLYPWLLRQWQRGAIVASLCTGTFVLAEAGLLDRRRATTSWWLEKQFHRCYPAVQLDITREIVESDRVVSGSTLGVGTQLTLKLIDMLTTARISELTMRSVMFDVRVRADTDAMPNSVNKSEKMVVKVQEWFAKNIEKKIKLADAASWMDVSERTLIRYFKKQLGLTPRVYLQHMRIASAKSMLQGTNLRVAKVAERVGYSDVAFFQQVFRSHVGVSPRVFRNNSAKSLSAHSSAY